MILSKITKNLVNLNLIVFPFILVISTFISVIESYKYIGFFQKHINISPNLIYLISFVSFIILLRSEGILDKIKKNNFISLFYKLGTISFFISLLLYFVFNELETANYDNYVFATFHMLPGSLITTVLLLFMAGYIYSKVNKK